MFSFVELLLLNHVCCLDKTTDLLECSYYLLYLLFNSICSLQSATHNKPAIMVRLVDNITHITNMMFKKILIVIVTVHTILFIYLPVA